MKKLALTLEDTQWEKTTITHDRHVARAIVLDEEGFFYFVRVVRDDIFGKGAFIETAGGGVESRRGDSSGVEGRAWRERGSTVQDWHGERLLQSDSPP